MKRGLFTFALAALTIGLLGSCSKINERIDGLDNRVYDLENNKITSVEQQIAAINQSIADLETIRTNIQDLKNEQEAQGQDITALKAADITLEGKINGLKTYVDTELSKYATKDWANATFATLEQHQWTCDTIAKIDARIGALDAKLSQSISGLENSLKKWVNEQLDAYYTAAQMDAKLGVMQSEIDALKNSKDSERIDSLATELTKTKAAVDTAKANIRTEYKNAIDVAINKLDGEIRGALLDSIAAVNARIEALDTRVTTLEGKVLALEGKVDKLLAMIQSVSITPAYSDGSVEAVNGILTLKCIVSPAEAIIGMESLKDSLVLYADSVKVKTKGASAYMTIKVSEASVLDAAQGAITLKADISEYLPKGEDKALTIAVNIRNGISDFTTEFVPVTVAAANPIVAYVEIAAKYDGSTVSTLRWYRQSLAITESGKKAWKDDSGSPVKVPGTDEDVVVGDYFQWGTFTGFYGNGAGTDKGLLPYTSFTSTGCGDGSNAFTFKDGKQFNRTNTPYWSGSAYTKYNATDKKTELDASDDVASIILGGTWRMPTKDEIKAMKEATYWAWDATDKGYYVYAPNPATDAGKVNDGTGTYNKADALLFFPATGCGDGTSMSNADTYGYYRSSTLCTTNTECAYRQFFNGTTVYTDNYTYRYCGFSVRPVQDPKATYKAVTSVSLNETSKNITVGGNLQLKATVIPDDATQQGVYWTSSAPTVATVDATGKVTAVAAGTATITATTVDGSKTTTCTVTVVKEVKTMAEILKTATGIPESKDLTPPANAWVNSTDPDCKAFVGIDAEGDKLFVIKKEGSGLTPLGICMDDDFEKIDDNTYQRIEPSVGTFTIKMTEGKFTSYEFTAASGSASEQFNGTYSAPVSSPTFKAVYDTNGGANTLTFYYDAVDHSGEGITVYEDGTDKFLFDDTKTYYAKWGYNDNRSSIKSVVIDASVAGYKGLTSTAFMFQGMATATNISGAEYLDVSNVTDMSYMFQNFGGGSTNSHTTLNSVPDVSNWNTANVTNMTGMFNSYGNFSDNLTIVPDVSNWNTANVTNMANMFQKYGHESTGFNAVPDVSKWNTGKVEDMHQMFIEYGHKSTALTAVPDVCNWNTAEVKTMAEMFREYGASSTVLKAVPDVSGWNTGKVTTVLNMFQNYGKGSVDFVLDLSGWDLSKITSNKGDNVFDFTPNTFNVTIPAKTGEKSNEGDKWYYGNGTNYIEPPTGKTFTFLPAGALNGVFSVSTTKKVQFSQGNLFWDGDSYEFEENQYTIGTWNAENHVNYFFWSKEESVAKAESYSDASAAASDVFFTNATAETAKADFTVNGVTGEFRNLSAEEWTYILSNRENAANLLVEDVTVCGVEHCLVIAPDACLNSYVFDKTKKSYDAAAWATAEAAGLVCLPPAGYRDGTEVKSGEGNGFYWASTTDAADKASNLGFKKSDN